MGKKLPEIKSGTAEPTLKGEARIIALGLLAAVTAPFLCSFLITLAKGDSIDLGKVFNSGRSSNHSTNWNPDPGPDYNLGQSNTQVSPNNSNSGGSGGIIELLNLTPKNERPLIICTPLQKMNGGFNCSN